MSKRKYPENYGFEIYRPGDYITIEIPFRYVILRSYFPDCDRWADRAHIACIEDYTFKYEQPDQNKPICGIYDQNKTIYHKYNMKKFLYGRRKHVKICQNCVTKILNENKLHINHDWWGNCK